MKNVWVLPASMADAEHVARNLRDEDRAEVLAAGGFEPLVLLPSYLEGEREVYSGGVIGRKAGVLFGCDPVIGSPETGVIWLLGTDDIIKYPREFLGASRRIWATYHSRYEVLTNFVDERNTKHIRWLEWLGARFIRRVENYGAQSLPFLEFVSLK